MRRSRAGLAALLLGVGCSASKSAVDTGPLDSAPPSGDDLSAQDFTPDRCVGVYVGDVRFSALQEALDAAPEGARVLLCPGTWGPGVMAVNGLTLEGWGAPEEVVVDGGGEARTLSFEPECWPDQCALTLRSLSLTGGVSTRGGALAFGFGLLTLEHVRATGNAAESGGALSVDFAEVRAEDVTLSGNVAEEGGALAMGDSQVVGDGLEIAGNTATRGGGVWGWSYDGYASSELHGAHVHQNTADEGGGVFVYGTARHGADLLVVDSLIEDNEARVGGGFFEDTDYGSLGVEDSVIRGNHASEAGGGVALSVGGLLQGTEILENEAPIGGGLAAASAQRVDLIVQLGGGAMQGNVADEGGGLRVYGGDLVILHAVDFGGPDNLPEDALLEDLSLDWDGPIDFICRDGFCLPP
ncbi:MAG: hypothetical protein H6741_06880 [Alphaproteobacteria bacterium]|nr:hypothetical protein [Alphaproteobacteria bacterium]